MQTGAGAPIFSVKSVKMVIGVLWCVMYFQQICKFCFCAAFWIMAWTMNPLKYRMFAASHLINTLVGWGLYSFLNPVWKFVITCVSSLFHKPAKRMFLKTTDNHLMFPLADRCRRKCGPCFALCCQNKSDHDWDHSHETDSWADGATELSDQRAVHSSKYANRTNLLSITSGIYSYTYLSCPIELHRVGIWL